MSNIHIPPAALEAGARAICDANGWPHSKAMFCDEVARAAFVAMVEAWEGMRIKSDPYNGLDIVLPLTEKTDDKA